MRKKNRKRKQYYLCAALLSCLLFPAPQAPAAILSEARIIGLPDAFYDSFVAPAKGKKVLKAAYLESAHRGTYREIGESQARFILAHDPGYVKRKMRYVDTLLPPDNPQRKTDVAEIRGKISAFFPEILEEIEGFAGVMGLGYDDAVRLYTLYGVNFFMGNCTIVAASSGRTGKGIIVGRNYDWIPSLCDISLVKTEPAGGYASAGMSENTLGRLDGMNEHGLFIGIAASPAKAAGGGGFLFPIVIRAVLDKAKNTAEALDVLGRVPHGSSFNCLVADAGGSAAVVEILPGRRMTVRWLRDDPDGLLVCTNHFQNEGSRGKNSLVMPNSLERARILRRKLGGKQRLGANDVEHALTRPRPDGVFFDNYEGIFGNIYSEVFDLGEKKWSTRAGTFRKEYSLEGISDASVPVSYNNRPPDLADYISFDGYHPVEPGSLTGRYGMSVYVSPSLVNPILEASLGYKAGLFGTERTYGPHIEASLFVNASPAFSRAGMTVALRPVPLFSLELQPFWHWNYPSKTPRFLLMKDSLYSGPEKLLAKVNPGLAKMHAAPVLSVNPVFSLGGIVTLRNRLTFYFFRETSYLQDVNLLVKRTFVWSPSLEILIPYSRRFLWGLQTGGNLKAALEKNPVYVGPKRNLFLGPMLVFPQLFNNVTGFVIISWYPVQSGAGDRFSSLLGMRGAF